MRAGLLVRPVSAIRPLSWPGREVSEGLWSLDTLPSAQYISLVLCCSLTFSSHWISLDPFLMPSDAPIS